MKKKLLAMLLIMCMIVGSSVTTFAAEGIANSVSSNATGSSTVSGNGDVSYANTKIYKVDLPTSGSMNLIIDPQGLTQLEEGKDVSSGDLKDGAGLITTASPLFVTNLSSVPMKITVKMKVTGDDATVVKTPTAVSANTTDNILLYAVPAKEDTKGVSSNYVAAAKGIVLDTSDVTTNFVLDEAEYVFSKSGDTVTYKQAENGEKHGFAVQLEGKVNPSADWSAYVGKEGEPAAKKIGWEATFSFDAAGVDKAAADALGYGMMEYTGDTVDIPAKDVAPTFTTGETVGTINYTKGLGNKELVEIVSIELELDGTKYDGYNIGAAWSKATDDGSLITFDPVYTNCFKANATTEAIVTYKIKGSSEKQTTTVMVKTQ